MSLKDYNKVFFRTATMYSHMFQLPRSSGPRAGLNNFHASGGLGS